MIDLSKYVPYDIVLFMHECCVDQSKWNGFCEYCRNGQTWRFKEVRYCLGCGHVWPVWDGRKLLFKSGNWIGERGARIG